MVAVAEQYTFDRLCVELGVLLVWDMDVSLASGWADVCNRGLDARVCLMGSDVTLKCTHRHPIEDVRGILCRFGPVRLREARLLQHAEGHLLDCPV